MDAQNSQHHKTVLLQKRDTFLQRRPHPYHVNCNVANFNENPGNSSKSSDTSVKYFEAYNCGNCGKIHRKGYICPKTAKNAVPFTMRVLESIPKPLDLSTKISDKSISKPQNMFTNAEMGSEFRENSVSSSEITDSLELDEEYAKIFCVRCICDIFEIFCRYF